MANPDPNSPSRRRHRARRRAVQALYQQELTGEGWRSIEQEFAAERDMQGVDQEYFADLLQGVWSRREELDGRLSPLLDRPLERLDPVERAILRLGAFELLARLEVPWRAALNEAVELAKTFGAEQSHRYVNGVLDRLARDEPLRAAEMARRGPRRSGGGG